jgi:hypothetical protein
MPYKHIYKINNKLIIKEREFDASFAGRQNFQIFLAKSAISVEIAAPAVCLYVCLSACLGCDPCRLLVG